MQYKLNQENVGRLYKEYKTSYEQYFAKWADSAVRDVIGKFGGTDFWTKRAEAAEIMRKAIDDKFVQEKSYVRCVQLQVLNVKFLSDRERSLIETQVAKQQGKTLKKEQAAKAIRSQISLVESQAQKNITTLQGNGTAMAKSVQANASSISTNMTISAQSAAYKSLDTDLAINPSNILDQFLYYSNMLTGEASAAVLKGFNKVLIKL